MVGAKQVSLSDKRTFPEKLARRVLARRIPLIVLFVLLAVPSFLLLLRVRIDNSSDIWFRKSSERYLRYRQFLEEFGSDRLFVVAYEHEDLFAPGPFAGLKTVADGLRALDGVEQPIVVFCTTENDMSHIQEAIKAGANEYIMKPFDSEIIESKFIQVGLL